MLIAHWPINDAVGRPSPATIHDEAAGGAGAHDGEVTTWGYAYLNPVGVDGVNLGQIDQYGGWVQNIANPSDLRINGEVTLMIWASNHGYSGWNNNSLLMSCDGLKNGSSAENTPWRFEVYQRKLRFRWYTGSSWVTIVTPVVLRRMGAQHMASVRYEVTPGSPGTYGVRFYVDGQLVYDDDNSGAGYTGPVGGENSIPYLGRSRDLVNTYQTHIAIDSAWVYNSAEPALTISNTYNAEYPQVHPVPELLPDIHVYEDTPDGSKLEGVEVEDYDPITTADGTLLEGVEVEDYEPETTGDGTLIEALDSGPLSKRERAGWVIE